MRYLNFLKEMEQLQHQMENTLRNVSPFSPSACASRHVPRHYPKINLREDEGCFYVDALMPGVEPKEIDISVLGNTLSISGERVALDTEDNVAWHRRERSLGRFCREVELPVEVNAGEITAESKNGLLKINLPKKAEAKAQKIAVKIK